MIHGDDKAFEMARSLLPSTNRQSIRKGMARVKRSARRTERLQLAWFLRDAEAWEDHTGSREEATARIKKLVGYRRRSDKVNPFVRWAKKRTLDVPRDLRLEQAGHLVPPGLIGDHALGHLDCEEHFQTTAEQEHEGTPCPGSYVLSTREGPRWVDRGLAAVLLRDLMSCPGGQKALNAHIKRTCAEAWSFQRGHDGRRHVVLQGPETPRTLTGQHDVRSFLRDVHQYRTAYSWDGITLSGTATQEFLRVFHQMRGDLDATLAALPKKPLPRLATAPAP